MSAINRLLTIALLTISLSAPALEINQIEELFAHNNVAELQALHTTAADNSYATVLLNYRLAAALIQNGDKKTAKTVLNSTIKQVRKTIETAPQPLQAEYQVMLGALYGLKIIVQPLSAIGLNRKATKALKKARELEPQNPRALLMLGVAKFQTPGVFGGSSKKALALLKEGLAGVTEDDPINWGKVDLHLWLGRVYSKLERPDEALNHYQQALQLSSENHWVIEAMKGNGFDSQSK
ncbi:MAG: tetratricopeptide repeat protein [Porticoccaceae bacterium]|nr:tetratricopeptide repeat protein [Porticoccaceae bacterium]